MSERYDNPWILTESKNKQKKYFKQVASVWIEMNVLSWNDREKRFQLTGKLT
jgi:hypothetical protein